MPILEVNNLSKSFGGINAVTNINMSVEKGEIVGLIGPNGAGKTTFFNLLTGIYVPSSGDIKYNINKEVKAKKLKPYMAVKYGISRTFQNIRLLKDISVFDNVRLGFHCSVKYGLLSSFLHLPSYCKEEGQIQDKVLKILDIFKLSDKKDELAKNLPYGEQRRLEIARALAAAPGLLLLDEPAAGMNPNETQELMELIKWIRSKFNLTIILIEHDMSLVMGVCSKIFVFNYGSLIANGSPEEIQNNPEVIKAYLGGEENA
ncbi:MAG: transporter ATP-binding protein [Clostridiales bacterium]|nr:transporter ATP-binding protein [Clostridiales bacterium]